MVAKKLRHKNVVFLILPPIPLYHKDVEESVLWSKVNNALRSLKGKTEKKNLFVL